MPAPRQVGPFEILEPLGAGGMGEVFKARDTRLNRLVAIKFLPEEASVTARDRFQREAQAIAALNHANICTLFEVGEHAGRPYLVLELLEGESLKMRLRRGALASDQVLDWALEIADALDAAHRKGVLHRDLKPDNLWVTSSGHVKVLDFGLARLESEKNAESAAEAPTLGADRLLTSPGQTMGTIPYMSPEQARGEPLDPRSDLFSFGTVLYEMASGRQAFAGRSGAEVSAAILKEQPPRLSTVRAELPSRFEDAVHRCLEKDPDLRYQSAADLRGELKRLKRESGSSSQTVAAVASPPRRRGWSLPAAAAAVLLAFGALAWRGLLPFAHRAAPDAAPQLQFRQLTFSGHVEDAVISPDGKFLAHVDEGPKGTSLHLLSIASNSDTEIMPPAPGCCQSPSFSPDGGQVYFLENRVLKAIPLLGGEVRTIVPAACSGAGFSPDGTQIAYVVNRDPASNAIELARADGSQARTLRAADPATGFASQCWGSPNLPTHAPAWSPDGTRIAVVQSGNNEIGHVTIINAADGRATALSADVGFTSDVAWLPDGNSVVLTALKNRVQQVWRLPVPSGPAAVVTNDLFGYDSASVSAAGELAVVHVAPQYSIWTQTRPGGGFAQLPGGGSTQDGYFGLAWTPSGGLVTTRKLAANWQLWAEAGDGSGSHAIELPSNLGSPAFPAVAPGGAISFTGQSRPNSVWRMAADGTGPAELVHPGADAQAIYSAVVRGGAEFAFLYFDAQENQTLWSAPVAGGPARQLSSTFVFADGIAASPDGSRIFVVSRALGKVTHVPMIIRADNGQATPVPGMDFNTMPGPYGFTADGRAITYIANQGTVDNIWADPIAGGKPYPLTHFTDLRIAAYAMSKDGRLAVSRGSSNRDAVVATGLAPDLAGGSH